MHTTHENVRSFVLSFNVGDLVFLFVKIFVIQMFSFIVTVGQVGKARIGINFFRLVFLD